MRWRLVQSAYLPPNPPPTKPIPGWGSAWPPSLLTVNTCTPKTVSTYTYFIYIPGCAFWCGEQTLHVLQPNFCRPVSMGGDVCGRNHVLHICGKNHAHSTVRCGRNHAHSTVCLWGKLCTHHCVIVGKTMYRWASAYTLLCVCGRNHAHSAVCLWEKPCTLSCVFVGETMHTQLCVCGRNMHCVLIVSMKSPACFSSGRLLA